MTTTAPKWDELSEEEQRLASDANGSICSINVQSRIRILTYLLADAKREADEIEEVEMDQISCSLP
jgi:hypothetical protein